MLVDMCFCRGQGKQLQLRLAGVLRSLSRCRASTRWRKVMTSCAPLRHVLQPRSWHTSPLKRQGLGPLRGKTPGPWPNRALGASFFSEALILLSSCFGPCCRAAVSCHRATGRTGTCRQQVDFRETNKLKMAFQVP